MRERGAKAGPAGCDDLKIADVPWGTSETEEQTCLSIDSKKKPTSCCPKHQTLQPKPVNPKLTIV